MAKLIIEGDRNQLEVIAKQNGLRSAKYGLKISIEEPKKQEASKPPVKEHKPKASKKKSK